MGGDGSTYAVDEWINQAESYMCNISNYNWIDNYSSLNADVKMTLQEACSNLGAIYAIQYNMTNYTTRIEAEDMINILWARFNQCIELLKEKSNVTYVRGA